MVVAAQQALDNATEKNKKAQEKLAKTKKNFESMAHAATDNNPALRKVFSALKSKAPADDKRATEIPGDFNHSPRERR